jgi:hypothetical protein
MAFPKKKGEIDKNKHQAFQDHFNPDLKDFDSFRDDYEERRRVLGLGELPPTLHLTFHRDKIIDSWVQAAFFKHIFKDLAVSSLTAPEVARSLVAAPLTEQISATWGRFLSETTITVAFNRAIAMCRVLKELMYNLAPRSAEVLRYYYPAAVEQSDLAKVDTNSWNPEGISERNEALLLDVQRIGLNNLVAEIQRALGRIREHAQLTQEGKRCKAERLHREARERQELCSGNSAYIREFFGKKQTITPSQPALLLLGKEISGLPRIWRSTFEELITAAYLILDELDYRGLDHNDEAVDRMIEDLQRGDRIFTRKITAQDIGSQGIKKLAELLFDPTNLCSVLKALSTDMISDNDIKKHFQITLPIVTPREKQARELASLYHQDEAAREAIDNLISQDDLNLFVAALLLPKSRIEELRRGGGLGFPEAIKDALFRANDANERIDTIKEKRLRKSASADQVCSGQEQWEADISTLRTSLGEESQNWELESDGSGGVVAVRKRDSLVVELNPTELREKPKKLLKIFSRKLVQAEKDRPAQGLIDTLLGVGFTWREKTLIHIESGLQLVLDGHLSERFAELGKLHSNIIKYQRQQRELRQVLIESSRMLVLDAGQPFAYHFDDIGEDQEIDLPPIPHDEIERVLQGAQVLQQHDLPIPSSVGVERDSQSSQKATRLLEEYHQRLQIKATSQVLILDANIIFDLVRGRVNDESLSRILSALAKLPHQKIIIPATVVFEVVGWIPPEDWSPYGGDILFPSSERRHFIDLLRNRFSLCALSSQGELSPLGRDFSRSSKLMVVCTEDDRNLMQDIRNIWNQPEISEDLRRTEIKNLFVGRDLGEQRIAEILSLIPQTQERRVVCSRDRKFRRDMSRMPNLELRNSTVGLFGQAATYCPQYVARVFSLSPLLEAGQLVDALVAGLRR